MSIREIRRAKNITQKELAQAIGVDETVVSRYEKGIINPPAERLEKIASYLNVSVNTLLDKKESIPIDYYIDQEQQVLVEYDMRRADEFAAAKRIMAYVKGICELCGKPAPFCTKDGEPYLEAHFIDWLSEGGRPTIDNVVALCPNCHKKIHVLKLKEDLEYLRMMAKKHSEMSTQ